MWPAWLFLNLSLPLCKNSWKTAVDSPSLTAVPGGPDNGLSTSSVWPSNFQLEGTLTESRIPIPLCHWISWGPQIVWHLGYMTVVKEPEIRTSHPHLTHIHASSHKWPTHDTWFVALFCLCLQMDKREMLQKWWSRAFLSLSMSCVLQVTWRMSCVGAP